MTTGMTIGVNEFRSVARMTELIAQLPAVATLDWADRAAGAMLPMGGRLRVCLMVARVEASGGLTQLETVGVAAAKSVEDDAAELTIRSRSERIDGIGIPAPAAGHVIAGRAADLLGAGWRESGPGRIWTQLHAADVLIGAIGIGRPEDARAVVIHAARVDQPEVPAVPFTAAQADMLRAISEPLARRTLLALGDDRNASTRWLTAREQEVLEKLTLGMSVREIAEAIGRSPHTVHDHVKSLHRKLNATSRGELVARALGYIDAQGRTAEAKAPLGDRAKTEVEQAVRDEQGTTPGGSFGPQLPVRQTARRLNVD